MDQYQDENLPPPFGWGVSMNEHEEDLLIIDLEKKVVVVSLEGNPH